MDEVAQEGIHRKFDKAYVLDNEMLAFTNMPSICELEERHCVNLCVGYKNYQACSTFMKFIAHDQLRTLRVALLCSKFLASRLMPAQMPGMLRLKCFGTLLRSILYLW